MQRYTSSSKNWWKSYNFLLAKKDNNWFLDQFQWNNKVPKMWSGCIWIHVKQRPRCVSVFSVNKNKKMLLCLLHYQLLKERARSLEEPIGGGHQCRRPGGRALYTIYLLPQMTLDPCWTPEHILPLQILATRQGAPTSDITWNPTLNLIGYRWWINIDPALVSRGVTFTPACYLMWCRGSADDGFF